MTSRPSIFALGRHLWRFLLALGVLIGAFSFSPSAWTQGATLKDFDHAKTGFALSGVHARERCESCHVNGVFKGTPRDCETCHLGGNRLARNNVVKPVKHIPTTQTCDTCHTTAPATGRPSAHVPVGSTACDSCHATTGWKPTRFNHTQLPVAAQCS